MADHITEQIEAFKDKNFERAYSFAAVSFQENINLDVFTQSIQAQYFMLIDNSGVEFGQCEVVNGNVLQIVTVTSSQNNFILDYVLSIEDGKLGVVAAVVTSVSDTTVT